MLSQTMFGFLSMLQASEHKILLYIPLKHAVQKKIPFRKKKGHRNRSSWYFYSTGRVSLRTFGETVLWNGKNVVNSIAPGIVVRAEKRGYLDRCYALRGIPEGLAGYVLSAKGIAALAATQRGADG